MLLEGSSIAYLLYREVQIQRRTVMTSIGQISAQHKTVGFPEVLR